MAWSSVNVGSMARSAAGLPELATCISRKPIGAARERNGWASPLSNSYVVSRDNVTTHGLSDLTHPSRRLSCLTTALRTCRRLRPTSTTHTRKKPFSRHSTMPTRSTAATKAVRLLLLTRRRKKLAKGRAQASWNFELPRQPHLFEESLPARIAV